MVIIRIDKFPAENGLREQSRKMVSLVRLLNLTRVIKVSELNGLNDGFKKFYAKALKENIINRCFHFTLTLPYFAVHF